MTLEVEVKFAKADLVAIERAIREMGAAEAGFREETDLYFAHPARNFAQTDEALRLRRIGERNFLTYKGPKVDPLSKTRDEIELPLPPGHETAQRWKELFERLGFHAVAEVSKKRKKFRLTWDGWSVEISLDEVTDLGHFVELEIICENDQLEPARNALLDLAQRLGLKQSERRSYLELLLQNRARP